MSVRVRIAPSPTGRFHVGNARTALFNYLFAKQNNGSFIVRVEDTDIERSTRESEDSILEDLRWLQMDWTEGPDIGGDYGPYRQTDRIKNYKKYIDILLENGDAYFCFCTKEELAEQRAEAEANKIPFRYNQKCRNLSEEKRQELIGEGLEYSIRFKVQKDKVLINDIVIGSIEFETNAFGDFILIRSDGMPIYNFGVVIDDALMNITHVIRGNDHFSNAPKQALLFEALNFETPIFAHIPMIVGNDHGKLSKRHGATSVFQFRENGYLPEAMMNFLALLSWSPGSEQEIFTKEELIEKFSLDRVSKSAAIFDFDKLKWMNGIYIRNLDEDDYAKRCIPFIVKSGLLTEETINNRYEWYKKAVLSIRENLEVLGDAPEYFKVFVELQEIDDSAREILELPTTKDVLTTFQTKINDLEKIGAEEYKRITNEIKDITGAKGKALFMGIRVGITGATKGPDINSLITILPIKEMSERIDKVISKI